MKIAIGIILILLIIQYVFVLGGSYAIQYAKSLFVSDSKTRRSLYR